MKHIITILLLLTSLSVQAAGLEEDFKANVIEVSPYAAARTTDLRSFTGHGGVRVAYDLTSKFGFYAEADGRDFKKTLVENAAVGVKLGVPIGPVRIYGIGGFGLGFPSNEEKFSGGLGVQYRRGHIGAFVEGVAEKGFATRTGAAFKAGVSVNF